MAYPVHVAVEPAHSNRNRLTTAFRLILAIPHLILVGGIGFGVAYDRGGSRGFSVDNGLLGLVAILLAVVSWFTILIAGQHISGIRQFTNFYLRWRLRALAYLMLLEDKYPPFGDEPYPTSITIDDPIGERRRVSVLVRIFLAIPHFILLAFLIFAWWIVTFVAWLTIVFSGMYPAGMYDFAVGCLRWFLRVEAYVLLMVDEYPPFSLI